MVLQNIRGREERILEGLATYQFLIADQIVELGIVSHRNNLYPLLKNLLSKKMVNRIRFGVNGSEGKIPDLYYLTKKGVDFLINNLNYLPYDIKKPKRAMVGRKFFYHTKSMVDFHIYYRQTLEKKNKEYDFLTYDFEKDDNGESVNKVYFSGKRKNAVIADILTSITVGGEQYLFVTEIHRHKNVKRVIGQIFYHFLAEKQGDYKKDYNYDNFKVLYVVDGQSTEKIIKRINESKVLNKIDNIEEKIFFKNMKTMQYTDFFTDWKGLDNKADKILL